MLCAISGESPQVPVASRKSGNIFEKRLIEAYISENGTDPVTNEELSTDDLIDLKSARVVRPRPPTLTSVPSLLSIFQNEWDALALETYTLKQHLTQTRQELSTALYQHDAAVRVIARLSRERDEARDALSKITMNGGPTSNGDSMQIDGQGLSGVLIAKVDATQEKLSKTRRKRVVPEDWADADTVQSLKPQKLSDSLYPGSRSLSLNENGELALFGGADGVAGVYSIAQQEVIQTLRGGGGNITDGLWAGSRAILATSRGTVKVFDGASELSSFYIHAGEATSIALHPSGDILASVGVDKSYVFYDLESLTVAIQIYTDSSLTTAAFHPDGHLFAAGGLDGQIKVFDVKSGANAANFESTGPIQSLSFSENGTWLASVTKGENSVSIWDLRKAAQIRTLEIGSQINCVRWDYTGQFLLAAGPGGLSIQQYSKATKAWTEPLRSGSAAISAEWGPKARSIVSLGPDGSIFEFVKG
ncbi:hypothetical protein MMC19_001562 [Ptychographa xylographoides]|nr:hypothetical protein [Ptychographa xylographoides]